MQFLEMLSHNLYKSMASTVTSAFPGGLAAGVASDLPNMNPRSGHFSFFKASKLVVPTAAKTNNASANSLYTSTLAANVISTEKHGQITTISAEDELTFQAPSIISQSDLVVLGARDDFMEHVLPQGVLRRGSMLFINGPDVVSNQPAAHATVSIDGFLSADIAATLGFEGPTIFFTNDSQYLSSFSPGDYFAIADTPMNINGSAAIYQVHSVDLARRTITIATPDNTTVPPAEFLRPFVKTSLATISYEKLSSGETTPGGYGLAAHVDLTFVYFDPASETLRYVTGSSVAGLIEHSLMTTGTPYGPVLVPSNNDVNITVDYPATYTIDVGSAIESNLLLGNRMSYAEDFPHGISESVIIAGNYDDNATYPVSHTAPIEKSVFVGNNAGCSASTSFNTLVGYAAGAIEPGGYNSALGAFAGENYMGINSVSIGYCAGKNLQGINSVAVGALAGEFMQGSRSVAVGYMAGNLAQGTDAVAFGINAGQDYQGPGAIAIGSRSGRISQGAFAIALGADAAPLNQPPFSVAIGRSCPSPGAVGRLGFGGAIGSGHELTAPENSAGTGINGAAPANAEGFIRIELNGLLYKIPVYLPVP